MPWCLTQISSSGLRHSFSWLLGSLAVMVTSTLSSMNCLLSKGTPLSMLYFLPKNNLHPMVDGKVQSPCPVSSIWNNSARPLQILGSPWDGLRPLLQLYLSSTSFLYKFLLPSLTDWCCSWECSSINLLHRFPFQDLFPRISFLRQSYSVDLLQLRTSMDFRSEIDSFIILPWNLLTKA